MDPAKKSARLPVLTIGDTAQVLQPGAGSLDLPVVTAGEETLGAAEPVPVEPHKKLVSA